MKRILLLALTIAVALGTGGREAYTANLTDQPHQALRDQARKANQEGNYKDAYEFFRKFILKPDMNVHQAPQDINLTLSSLASLNRDHESDAVREELVEAHSGNWRILQAMAHAYLNANHNGFIVAGEYERGSHRGGGEYANSFERDRIRALQLMEQAMAVVMAEAPPDASATFCMGFAGMLLQGCGHFGAWKLNALSDTTRLPDYETGYHQGWYGGNPPGAAVDEIGDPLFHTLPDSYESAATDGQRWRWLLWKAVDTAPSVKPTVDWTFAEFLHQQFGVQTMAQYNNYFHRSHVTTQDKEDSDTSGTYALHTLGRDETIAKLATGIRRFTLPDEYDFMRIFQELADDSKGPYAETALNKLAEILSNRRQYPESAEIWDLSIDRYGPGHNNYKKEKVRQIRANWGQFDPVMSQPNGSGATVNFKFRNGEKVQFTAHRIGVKTLIDDVKAYLRTNPGNIDWEKINIGQIGYRLVEKNQQKYVGKEVASWNLALDPSPRHFDRLVTVETPLTDGGAYLLTAHMKGGNTCKIVMWVEDTVIVKKPLAENAPDQPAAGPAYVYVADAVTGSPVDHANVEFFGYWQESLKRPWGNRHYNVKTTQFAEHTDRDGQVIAAKADLFPADNQNLNWIIIATTEDGRFAHLGFSHIWHVNYYDAEYNQVKAYGITDRPVYRPNQPLKFKFWVRYAKYDLEDQSAFAKGSFTVRVRNPKGDIIDEQGFTADESGGLDGEYMLPADAMLGVYTVSIDGNGQATFRVEEYKKPEFEVTVESPTEPMMLGDVIDAKISATYYFGAPVTKATVSYKVTRTGYTAEWYPYDHWDWFYGQGYWWFGYNYEWWPGWGRWGCFRPWPFWWPQRQDPPEVVAEGEVPLGEDGSIPLRIDTALAKEMHGNLDHRYQITAEVRDASRRTIVGQGTVIVARQPFKVYAWVDRGHYRVGDSVRADFSARTPDKKPVEGKGHLTLFKVSYDKEQQPVETAVREWDLDTNAEGVSHQQFSATESGQYRVSYTVTDPQGHAIDGGYVFVVRGDGFDGREFRFNQLELIPNDREYRPGETVNLMINTEQRRGTVVLFLRPANGAYLKPKVIRLNGKSTVEQIEIVKRDMPNFFIEAFTVSNGKVHSEVKEIVVPPEKRVLNVDVVPSKSEYKPGEEAGVEVRLTDFNGEPFRGTTVMTVYDKALEYISGGANVPEIKEFFWKWRRQHNPATEHNVSRMEGNLTPKGKTAMQALGVFGHTVIEEIRLDGRLERGSFRSGGREMMMKSNLAAARAPMGQVASMESFGEMSEMNDSVSHAVSGPVGGDGMGGAPPTVVEPVVRKDFADNAFWKAALDTDESGYATVTFDMPENLTGWKIRTWGMGHGTRVGEGTAEVVTTKNLLLRLQAPRFFVEKDEVVLSANIHNYLESDKTVQAVLELDGDTVEPMGETTTNVTVKANGETRVDWRVKVVREGEITVRMKALTDEESDAMQLTFPVYVHGMLKTDSFSGAIRPEGEMGTIEFEVPAERRIDQSRVEVRYSPTLAGALVDALPYLVDYPYGCTEQTLSRFLPTVQVQKILLDMGLDLEAIRTKRANLNAQEIGDDVERAKQWKRFNRNPVFDVDEVNRMVKDGLKALYDMQMSDGGWGWFSGYGERSWPHTTAYVVHGLQIAEANDVAVVPDVLARGVRWLERYQKEQVSQIRDEDAGKDHADSLDAFIFMVLVDADVVNPEMLEFLYRDRNHLSVYAKAMFGLALHKLGESDKLDMIMRNIEQYLVQDDENQTAYLDLPNGGTWWYWYGSEFEAHAYYLKLLNRLEPKSEKAAGLVKYLLNNRKHATYWQSTRDTAVCIEAMAEYLKASGEDKPDMKVEVFVDGERHKSVTITASDLFTFDNKLVLEGDVITSGTHTIELRKSGTGPLYYNAYVSYFTLEDYITKAGLEVRVNRQYYRLNRVEKAVAVAGSRGQAVDQQVEKYEREPLADLSTLKSGDLVEIELVIESKNDYEYLVFEDMKPAGFEPVDLRSGYTDNAMRAYVEFRDERVAFFVNRLARGTHSVAYRMRAEIPGRFSALPTRGYAMYAPELKANSDEIKLNIEDE